MLIVSNNERFPARWRAQSGSTGEAVFAANAKEFMDHRDAADEVVFFVDCDVDLALRLAASLAVTRSPYLVAADLVVRRPKSLHSKATVFAKSKVLRRVDLFINYFRDVSRLKEYYPIRPHNSRFVPFKPNLADSAIAPSGAQGEYVLTLGRSLRDFDTFAAAMEQTKYPAVMPEPDWESFAQHGARADRLRDGKIDNISFNSWSRAEWNKHDLTSQSEASLIDGAKLVVIPILSEAIVAAGIGTILNAMFFGKCVIATEGPGVSDIFTDEIVAVPPEDPTALAATIRRYWEDDALRRRTAAAGQAYARRLGGEAELYQRFIDAIAEWRSASA